MDHTELLKEIASHFDQKTSIMREDIKEVATKLDNYSERLTVVETEHGFIKLSLKWVLGLVATATSYIAAKWFDIKL